MKLFQLGPALAALCQRDMLCGLSRAPELVAGLDAGPVISLAVAVAVRRSHFGDIFPSLVGG